MTVAFLEKKMKIVARIKHIYFQHIPKKSHDISAMDYCTFDPLKRALSKREQTTIVGLWKNLKEEWDFKTFAIFHEKPFYHVNHDANLQSISKGNRLVIKKRVFIFKTVINVSQNRSEIVQTFLV